MPNKKLSDLPEWTTALTDDDLILLLPASETTQHYKLKKINLVTGVGGALTKENGSVSGATSGDNQTTGYSLSGNPTGAIMVFISGIKVELAGDKLSDCYFSVDGGSTARALGAAVSGDTLYWNGAINSVRTDVLNTLGNLAGGELIEIFY